MATTYYAWSPILAGTSDDPINKAFGDKVSKSDLKLNDSQWDQLVESGSVREMQPPEIPDTWQSSPIEYMRDQIKRASQSDDEAAVHLQMLEIRENAGSANVVGSVEAGTESGTPEVKK